MKDNIWLRAFAESRINSDIFSDMDGKAIEIAFVFLLAAI